MVQSYSQIVKDHGPESPEALGYKMLYQLWNEFINAARKVDDHWRLNNRQAVA